MHNYSSLLNINKDLEIKFMHGMHHRLITKIYHSDASHVLG